MSQIEFEPSSDPATLWADRADLFRIARALVDEFEWADAIDIYGVMSVARFLDTLVEEEGVG